MVNDMSMIYGLTIFFVLIGVIAPYFNDSFSDFSTPENDPEALLDDITEEDTTNRIGAFRVIGSVFTMFFWSFEVPIWANIIIFLPLRLLLVLIIARNIWIGGGS